MPRWNYVARRKPKEERKPAWQVKKERMYDLLDLIQKEKELKFFDAQKILGWGDGIMERILREVLAYYPNEVRYNTVERIIHHISLSPYQKQEVKN